VTVSDLVAALMAEGLVEELGVRAEGKVGKPASLVGMRTDAFQIVAVDLADDAWMRGAVLTLTGDVVERRSVALEGRTGQDAVDALEGLCRALLDAARQPVLGIGIGSPGIIDSLGTVVQAPNRHWYDVPLASDLTAALGVPVHVANDANTAALGEYTYGGASDSLLLLTVGEGGGWASCSPRWSARSTSRRSSSADLRSSWTGRSARPHSRLSANAPCRSSAATCSCG
jgi:hypothetical protein